MNNTKNEILYYDIPTSRKNLVIGMAGSGKDHNYVNPILNNVKSDTSYIVFDPAGTTLDLYAADLIKKGYNVKVLNFINPKSSPHYNPFTYANNEQDVKIIADALAKSVISDQISFFATTRNDFIKALVFYVYEVYKNQPEKQTLYSVLELQKLAEVSMKSFKKKFMDLTKANPNSIAVEYYLKSCTKCTEETLKSIIFEIGEQLSFLSYPNCKTIFADNEIDLNEPFHNKTALFVITEPEFQPINVISTIFIRQLMDLSYHNIDTGLNMRMILNEFQSMPPIPEFEKVISTIRRNTNLTIDIIIQSVNQLALYDLDEINPIIANIDTAICMGTCNMQDIKYVENISNINMNNIDSNYCVVCQRGSDSYVTKKINY